MLNNPKKAKKFLLIQTKIDELNLKINTEVKKGDTADWDLLSNLQQDKENLEEAKGNILIALENNKQEKIRNSQDEKIGELRGVLFKFSEIENNSKIQEVTKMFDEFS